MNIELFGYHCVLSEVKSEHGSGKSQSNSTIRVQFVWPYLIVVDQISIACRKSRDTPHNRTDHGIRRPRWDNDVKIPN